MSSGKLLDMSYNGYMFSKVKDLSDLFKSKLPEIMVVKKLHSSIKLCFNIPEDRLVVEVAEGDNIYKYTVLSTDIHKYPIGWFIYIPKQKRLDVYSQDSPSLPLIQWKSKRPVWKSYSDLLDKAGLDKIFSNIVNVLD